LDYVELAFAFAEPACWRGSRESILAKGNSPLTTRYCFMTPERWRQIDKLLEQALEQEASQRNL